MKSKLFFFTQSFPFSIAQETNFIKNEISILSESFSDIEIFPCRVGGEMEELGFNYSLNQKYSDHLKRVNSTNYFKRFLFGLFTPYLYGELLLSFSKINSPRKFLKLVNNSFLIQSRLDWFKENLTLPKQENSVFYTYWFDINTCALAIFLKNNSARVISRAHGIDVYEERNENYFPFRKYAFEFISKVVVISQYGTNYMKEKYPQFADKVRYEALGVNNDETAVCFPSSDKTVRIFSCSSLIKIKRVQLIYQSLKELRKQIPELTFHWTHCGDGELLEQLREDISEMPGLEVELLGHLSNREVFDFYRNNSIDFFIHLSATEGIPMVMMEAQSFGVLIIATDVGGVAQLVKDKDNGYLLPPNPTVDEVVSQVQRFLKLSEQEKSRLRANSKDNWRKNFNATVNYRKFAEIFYEPEP